MHWPVDGLQVPTSWHWSRAVQVTPERPIYVDRFLDNAIEIDTAVRHAAQALVPLKEQDIADLCASFQEAVVDVLVTKAGGLIISEGLAAGLPILLIDYLPGQEEGNVRYLLSHGRRDLPWVPDPRLGFEMTLLRLLAFRPGEGPKAAAGTASAATRPGAGTVAAKAAPTRRAVQVRASRWRSSAAASGAATRRACRSAEPGPTRIAIRRRGTAGACGRRDR